MGVMTKIERGYLRFQKRLPADQMLAHKSVANSNNCTMFEQIGVLTPTAQNLRTKKGL